MSHKVVNGFGPLPSKVMIVGEAPGREESSQGRPFVGRSGQEQSAYLARYHVDPARWYMTNVVKTYIADNPDPSPALVDHWTPHLIQEVEDCEPALIVAVGRFAARWFLGDSLLMESVHGLPHRPGAFDPSRASRAGSAPVILPIYHPAAGLHNADMRAHIARDYGEVAKLYRMCKGGRKDWADDVAFREDRLAGSESYLDISGLDIGDYLELADGMIAIDTEGYVDAPWSIQVAVQPGIVIVLRCSDPHFAQGITTLADYIACAGCVVAGHNLMHDIAICRVMGLELRDVPLFDTMYAAYLTKLEPQGLKPLAWRLCGMAMQSYDDTLGSAVDPQLEYLQRVATTKWPKVEPREVRNGDGTTKMYRPQAVDKRCAKILLDYMVRNMVEEEDIKPAEPKAPMSWVDRAAAVSTSFEDYTAYLSEGTAAKPKPLVDLHKRWRAIDKSTRREVEHVLGPYPITTLDDIPLSSALYYSARDADATLRLVHEFTSRFGLETRLESLMSDGMELLPVFEEMQAEGLTGDLEKFQTLRDDMYSEMDTILSNLRTKYYGGKPFNPGSSKQVGNLLRRRGLEPSLYTKTGQMSTSKKSIEHLRAKDAAIGLVFDHRERKHIVDSFCSPILERIDEVSYGAEISQNLHPITCRLKITRTHTRRLASADPNLLAVPSRTSLGKRVRDCYVCEPGEVLTAHDLSQIEMRVAADESGDEKLCRAFIEGRDTHAETAAKIFGVPLSQVDKNTQRAPIKTTAFGILYGIQAEALMLQLHMLGLTSYGVDDCELLIKEWLAEYSGIAAYIKSVIKQAGIDGYSADRWGMIRYIPGIWSQDPGMRAEAGRIAVSQKIQGGAQGLIQNSMRYLRPIVREMQRQGMNIKWRLQIHDEIILSMDEELWPMMDDIILYALKYECGAVLRVPVEAEGRCATTWAGLK